MFSVLLNQPMYGPLFTIASYVDFFDCIQIQRVCKSFCKCFDETLNNRMRKIVLTKKTKRFDPKDDGKKEDFEFFWGCDFLAKKPSQKLLQKLIEKQAIDVFSNNGVIQRVMHYAVVNRMQEVLLLILKKDKTLAKEKMENYTFYLTTETVSKYTGTVFTYDKKHAFITLISLYGLIDVIEECLKNDEFPASFGENILLKTILLEENEERVQLYEKIISHKRFGISNLLNIVQTACKNKERKSINIKFLGHLLHSYPTKNLKNLCDIVGFVYKSISNVSWDISPVLKIVRERVNNLKEDDLNAVFINSICKISSMDLKYYLSHPKIKPTRNKSECLKIMLGCSENVEMIKVLIADNRVNPFDIIGEVGAILHESVRRKSWSTSSFILKKYYAHFDGTILNTILMEFRSSCYSESFFKEIMRHEKADPTVVVGEILQRNHPYFNIDLPPFFKEFYKKNIDSLDYEHLNEMLSKNCSSRLYPVIIEDLVNNKKIDLECCVGNLIKGLSMKGGSATCNSSPFDENKEQGLNKKSLEVLKKLTADDRVRPFGKIQDGYRHILRKEKKSTRKGYAILKKYLEESGKVSIGVHTDVHFGGVR